MYGGSCVVTPMPWPVRWMNCSPYPASVITCRAARSISWQATPGPDRLERRPAAPAARSSCTSRTSADGSPTRHRAGGVRAVAVHQAAEVEDDRVAVLDDPVAGLVVRVGAVRAGADDGEVDLLVPELAQQAGEVGGDLGLLPAGEPDTEDLARTSRPRRRPRLPAGPARRRP